MERVMQTGLRRHGWMLVSLLAVSCGDDPPSTPTSPSITPDTIARAAASLEQGGTCGQFATASATSTLKVTSPIPDAPVDGRPLEGTVAVLAVTGPMGRFVEVMGLNLGFALWEIAADGSGSALIETGDVPMVMQGATTYAVESPLKVDTDYRWRARAFLDGAYGPWYTNSFLGTRAPTAARPTSRTTPT